MIRIRPPTDIGGIPTGRRRRLRRPATVGEPVRRPHRNARAAVAGGVRRHGREAVDGELVALEGHRPVEDRRAQPGGRGRRLPADLPVALRRVAGRAGGGRGGCARRDPCGTTSRIWRVLSISMCSAGVLGSRLDPAGLREPRPVVAVEHVGARQPVGLLERDDRVGGLLREGRRDAGRVEPELLQAVQHHADVGARRARGEAPAGGLEAALRGCRGVGPDRRHPTTTRMRPSAGAGTTTRPRPFLILTRRAPAPLSPISVRASGPCPSTWTAGRERRPWRHGRRRHCGCGG